MNHFMDGEGRPYPGLTPRDHVTVHRVEGSADLPERAAVGDLALKDGASGFVNLDDGWHSVGTITAMNDMTNYGSWTTTITLENVASMALFTGEDEREGRHEKGRVAQRGDTYVCLDCGAESADFDLFSEVGCDG